MLFSTHVNHVSVSPSNAHTREVHGLGVIVFNPSKNCIQFLMIADSWRCKGECEWPAACHEYRGSWNFRKIFEQIRACSQSTKLPLLFSLALSSVTRSCQYANNSVILRIIFMYFFFASVTTFANDVRTFQVDQSRGATRH